MTMYSQADIATRALRELGVVASDEAPSAEDLEHAAETISGLFLTMAAEGIAIVGGSSSAVPEGYLIPLGQYFAKHLAASFGAVSDKTELIGKQAEMTLRRMAAGNAAYTPVPAEYY